MAQDWSMLSNTATTAMNDPPAHCGGLFRPKRRGTRPSFSRQQCQGFCSRRKGILVLVSLLLSWATTSSAAVPTRWHHQQQRAERDGTQKHTFPEDPQYNQRSQEPDLRQQQEQQGQQNQKQRREQSSTASEMKRTVKFVYHDHPQLHWMQRLGRPASLQRGNAVVASPFDDTLLYVTTSAGVIFAISALNGTTMWEYTPPNKAVLLGTEELWRTTCKSGVTFGEIDTVGKFLVYAVIDLPPPNSTNAHQSRVIAISIPTHQLLWESTDLPGDVQGTPVVNSNQNDPRRKFVMITRNTKLSKSDNTTHITGQITLLSVLSGSVIWTESEGNGQANLTTQGYGPLGIVSSPTSGKFTGGSDNTNDVVVWASSGEKGQAKTGYTYALQLPPFFHMSTSQVNALKSIRLKEVRWSSVARPVLTSDGQELFLGITGSQLRGWIGDNPFDATANLNAELALNEKDPLAAIPTAPVLSLDELRLFLASASTQIACIGTKDGSTVWQVLGTSPFVAEPKVSPQDDRVYFIQSADGRMFSLDQTTGEKLWLISCDEYEEDCANSVVAEFALSRDGRFVYYGDVTGRLISLELGEYQVVELAPAPTPAPAPSPTPAVVSPLAPLSWSPPTQVQEIGHVKKGPTLAASIALIVIAIFIGTGASIYIFMMNNLKTYPHPMQEAHPDVQYDTHSPMADLTNVPDPYEDAMLNKHSPTEVSKPVADDTAGFYYEDGGTFHGDECPEDPDDSFSHAPADRISQRLGTANLPELMLPRSEDYSYGASVLL